MTVVTDIDDDDDDGAIRLRHTDSVALCTAHLSGSACSGLALSARAHHGTDLLGACQASGTCVRAKRGVGTGG